MDTSLAQYAINLALEAKWDAAKKANLEILKSNPNDIDALNRLVHAACELGEIAEAKKTCQKVLSLDPTNTIAVRSLEKLNVLKKGEAGSQTLISPEAFLESPGKTKLVSLLHPGDAKVLAKLDAGDEVFLSVSAHRVSVINSEGKYIGRLPDDLSARLRNLIKIGNKYQVLIKSVLERDVKIFVREIERAEGAKDITSFPMEKLDYVSFTPPELVHRQSEESSETELGQEE